MIAAQWQTKPISTSPLPNAGLCGARGGGGDSLVGEDSGLGKYITTPFEQVHNLALAVVAHDPFCLLAGDFERPVGLVCFASGVEWVICRVIEGGLGTLLSMLSEES